MGYIQRNVYFEFVIGKKSHFRTTKRGLKALKDHEKKGLFTMKESYGGRVRKGEVAFEVIPICLIPILAKANMEVTPSSTSENEPQAMFSRNK